MPHPSLLRFIQLSDDINYRGVKNIDAYFPQKRDYTHRRRRIRLIKRTLYTSRESYLSNQMTRDIQRKRNDYCLYRSYRGRKFIMKDFFSDSDRIQIPR